MSDDDALLRIPEVARRCNVAESTVAHWIQVGKLPATRPGKPLLIRESEVEALLERGRQIVQSQVVRRARRSGKASAPRGASSRGRGVANQTEQDERSTGKR